MRWENHRESLVYSKRCKHGTMEPRLGRSLNVTKANALLGKEGEA